ncbi:MAG TPA: hypothetical protein V6D47_10030 [Oscillatoriaceae cyanobacterium]
MTHLPNSPRYTPRYDEAGRLVGYARAQAIAEPAVEISAIGKHAVVDEGPIGRISDVIFELESGEIVAYECRDGGEPFYLPASGEDRETRSEVRLAPHTHRREHLEDLPLSNDPDEFVIVEELPPTAE